MTPNINVVQDQLVRIAREARKLPSEDREYSADELVRFAIRPLSEKLTEPEEALEFAARQIGETMIALLGFKSLHEMFDGIERDVGEEEAWWLCRAWVGLQSLDGLSTWSD